jgi:pyruvate/2-oxoglutarate dehydrogenase complex dihydrolipoamide acyltransferase (E2) component
VSSPPTDAATLVDVTMPQMGVSVAEGTVIAWRAQVGDRIEADETICEISTDKIDTEVPAPVAGTVAEILVEIDSTVPVGTVLARIATGDEGQPADRRPPTAAAIAEAATPAAGTVAAPSTAPASPTDGTARRRYSPVVQRIAAEHGIDLDSLAGSGRDGRVRKQDVLAAVAAGGGPGVAAQVWAVGAGPVDGAPSEPPLHIESPYRPEPAEPGVAAGGLSRIRRQIGEHMKRSLMTAATCTTWIEADMEAVQEARARLGLTALPFVARATVQALLEFPQLNAWLEGDRYTRHDGVVHLGIAVSLGEDGLIVPVVHNAQELSVQGLAARIRDLASRARARELSPDEVRGGTFTITNPGQFGSIMATPIINQPQVAILDLEAIVKRAVVVSDGRGGDSIAIRAMTILGLSWDHRALDGALSAQFLASVRRHLEAVADD